MLESANRADPTASDGPDAPGGRKPDRAFREFLAASRRAEDDDDGDRYAGFGVTLDSVIAKEVRSIEMHVEADSKFPRPQDPGDILDRMGDVAIWEGGQVAAVVQPRRDGVRVVKLGGDRGGTFLEGTPPALPEWASDPVALSVALDSARGAARNHVDATGIVRRVDLDTRDSLDAVGTAAADRFNKSCTTTLRAVLSWHGHDEDEPEKYPAANCALKVGGLLFAAVHSEEEDLRDSADEKATHAVMHLAVIPLDRIIDLDAIEAPSPALKAVSPDPETAAEEADDGPADEPPARVRGPVEPRDYRPFPLARTVLTVCLPSDTAFGAPTPGTVEVVVLARDSTHDNDVTATEDDLPELKGAGWRSYMMGAMTVYIRAIFG